MAIRDIIDFYIRQNGHEEITGVVLNSVLKDIVTDYEGILPVIDSLAYTGMGNSCVTAHQTPNPFKGSSSGWASYLIFNHGDGDTYVNQIIRMPFNASPQYARAYGDGQDTWHSFITSENIASQNVDNADKLGGKPYSYYLVSSDLNNNENLNNVIVSGQYNCNSETHENLPPHCETGGQLIVWRTTTQDGIFQEYHDLYGGGVWSRAGYEDGGSLYVTDDWRIMGMGRSQASGSMIFMGAKPNVDYNYGNVETLMCSFDTDGVAGDVVHIILHSGANPTQLVFSGNLVPTSYIPEANTMLEITACWSIAVSKWVLKFTETNLY